MDRRAAEPRQIDQAAMDRLAAQFREPLVRWFSRRGLSREAAEDCAQETFARIAGASGGKIDSPESYLFAIAASVLVDRARRARVRHEASHLPMDDFDRPSEEPTPANVFEGREALSRLANVLDELPAKTRQMFLLNRLDGLSYTQIAVRFGVTVSAVEKQMMKAIAHIQARFSRDG